MNVPSKELVLEVWFNGVYNEHPVTVERVSNYIDENQIALLINGFDYYYNSYTYTHMTINLYELAYKCKEWALSKHKFLVSGISRSALTDLLHRADAWYCSIGYKVCACAEGYRSVYSGCEHSETANTEPEAIFKACEWILRQVKEV